MKSRNIILIAVLCLLGCVKTLLAESDSSPAVVFSLKEWAHWAPVVGMEDPAFTLYDNRDLIYYNMDLYQYEYVQLTEEEYTRLKEEIIPKDLQALEHFYIRIYATCQNEYYFYFGCESERMITVYGHPTDNEWFVFEIPQSLRRCFNTLSGYRNHRAVPWLPEKVEVLAWDMFPSNQEYPEWPSDWPNLNSPDTVGRPYTPTVYSIFLPSELFDEFIALGDAGHGIVKMNGKPMCIWYRMPIPGEEIFDQEFEDPNYENTALHEAAFWGSSEEVETLLAGGADLNAQRADGKTALHLAVERGNENVTQLLITEGAEIETKTLYGNTPLLCALDFLQADMAGLLLAQGADPNITNSMGDTGLHYTTDDRLKEIVEQLIAGGLDVNGINDANDMPLYCASRDGAAGIVELLLNKGVDVNISKPDGRTALHATVSNGHIETVNLLIAHGANVNAKTKEGHTPLDYALSAGYEEIAALLRTAGGRLDVDEEEKP